MSILPRRFERIKSVLDCRSNINHQILGKYGIYNLWRIKKSDLNKYSNEFFNNGYRSNWRSRVVEKF